MCALAKALRAYSNQRKRIMPCPHTNSRDRRVALAAALILTSLIGCGGSEGPCSVEETPDGGAVISCPDGTSTTIAAPTSGSSCAVTQSDQGAEIQCEDGTTVVVEDGLAGMEGSSCRVEDTPEGGARVVCSDGSSQIIKEAPPEPTPQPAVLRTMAGVTSVGSNDGSGLETRMDGALHGDFGPDGEFLYFVDTFNNTVRRFGLRTQRVVTLAGKPGANGVSDGTGAQARFDGPRALAVHPSGDRVFIADGFNCTIRQLDLQDYEVTTLAGQPGDCGGVDGDLLDARFGLIVGMAMGPGGRYLYISDRGNDVIRRLDLNTDVVDTIAGSLTSSAGYRDGDGAQARFSGPGGIAISRDGSSLYINDTFNQVIRSISNTPPYTVETLAGKAGEAAHVDGVGADARFSVSQGLALAGDTLMMAGFHGSIRALDLQTREVTTVAGRNGASGSRDGAALDARFGVAFGVLAHPDGRHVYYMDRGNNSIRLFDRSTDTVTTVMGAPEPTGWRDGPSQESRLHAPSGLWLHEASHTVYLADAYNHVIRAMDTQTGVIRTIAGLPETSGAQNGFFDEARFDSPNDIWGSDDGQWLFVADPGNGAVRRVSTETGQVVTLRADDTLGVPAGLFGRQLEDGGLLLYIADAENGVVLSVELESMDAEAGTVALVAGGGDPDALDAGDPDAQDGQGAEATFDTPIDVALDATTARLYVLDRGHHLLRAVDLNTQDVTTIAGDRGVCDAFDGVGADATFSDPAQLALTPDGEFALIADASNHAIRAVEVSTGRVTTIVGELGVSGGDGRAQIPLDQARIYYPYGVAVGQEDIWLSADEALMVAPGEASRASQW